MAVITGDQKKRAAQLFTREAYKKTGNTATVDSVTIELAVQDVDDWFNAPPGGAGASRAASLIAAINDTFRNATSQAEKAILVSAWAAALAGL